MVTCLLLEHEDGGAQTNPKKPSTAPNTLLRRNGSGEGRGRIP